MFSIDWAKFFSVDALDIYSAFIVTVLYIELRGAMKRAAQDRINIRRMVTHEMRRARAQLGLVEDDTDV